MRATAKEALGGVHTTFDLPAVDTYIPRMLVAATSDSKISVVVPMFNEARNVGPLVSALEPVLQNLGMGWEIILVDDGSTDGTWEEILGNARDNTGVRGLSFARNFGHQNALLAGLKHAKGDAVVTMDGDLQHPPSVIRELVAQWQSGFPIVHTRRFESKSTGIFKRLSSKLFYRLFSALSGIALSAGSSDFRLIDRNVLSAINTMRDSGSFLRGLMMWTGYKSTTVDFQAEDRHAERTKYSLFRMLRFAGDAILSFSAIPLRIGIWIGLVTSLLAFAEIVYVLYRYGTGATVPGWASLAGIISFMFGVLFILVGIIGAYIGSIFEIVKNRPPYLIEQKIGFDDD